MTKEEWMDIWEKIFEKNKEEIENVPALNKEEKEFVVNSLGMMANILEQHGEDNENNG